MAPRIGFKRRAYRHRGAFALQVESAAGTQIAAEASPKASAFPAKKRMPTQAQISESKASSYRLRLASVFTTDASGSSTGIGPSSFQSP